MRRNGGPNVHNRFKDLDRILNKLPWASGQAGGDPKVKFLTSIMGYTQGHWQARSLHAFPTHCLPCLFKNIFTDSYFLALFLNLERSTIKTVKFRMIGQASRKEIARVMQPISTKAKDISPCFFFFFAWSLWEKDAVLSVAFPNIYFPGKMNLWKVTLQSRFPWHPSEPP